MVQTKDFKNRGHVTKLLQGFEKKRRPSHYEIDLIARIAEKVKLNGLELLAETRTGFSLELANTIHVSSMRRGLFQVYSFARLDKLGYYLFFWRYFYFSVWISYYWNYCLEGWFVHVRLDLFLLRLNLIIICLPNVLWFRILSHISQYKMN